MGAPDETLENDETREFQKKGKKNYEVPENGKDDKLEQELEEMSDTLEGEKAKYKTMKKQKAKRMKKMKKRAKKKASKESKEKHEDSKESEDKEDESEESKEKDDESKESEEETTQTIEKEEKDHDELKGKMTAADEKQARDEYLADLERTKQAYHERNPDMVDQENEIKIPKDDCTAIQTSYGGKWRRRQCEFRHYFLCNNPSKSRGGRMNNNMMGMRRMNRFNRMGMNYGMNNGMHNGMNSRFGGMNEMGMQNRMNMNRMNNMNAMRMDNRMNNGMNHKMHNEMNNINNGMHNGMNSQMHSNGMGMTSQHSQNQMNNHHNDMNQHHENYMHQRRRMLNVEDDEEKQLFLGNILKKITGAVGGIFRKKRMKK